jgi:hypothetical protein
VPFLKQKKYLILRITINDTKKKRPPFSGRRASAAHAGDVKLMKYIIYKN